MKKIMLLFPVLLLFWAGKPDVPKAKARVMEKNFVSVTDNLFAGKFEVSNIAYKEFLASFKDDPSRYKELNVASENWDNALAFSDPIKENYFSHPAFYEYPVVNVSQEGAQAYCAWLTDLYHTDPRRKYKKVVFRLPTVEEWEQAAAAGQEEAIYAWGGTYMQNAHGKYQCNFRVISQHQLAKDENNQLVVASGLTNRLDLNDQYLITAPVDAFPPNEFGLYNACGNVAEMTATEGLAKGGSWADTGYDVRIGSEKQFLNASPKVGFRVFMEILEF